ncbi:MAG TPA: KTSC domain-containing protein [Halomicronema sp.]
MASATLAEATFVKKIRLQPTQKPMKLSKIDLSSIIAAGHKNGQLNLLIDRGQAIELIEIPAPVAAYKGLQQVADITNSKSNSLTEKPTPQPISMLPVNSTMASAIGYDPDQQTLQVEFSSGKVYQYTDVEEETWESLCQADSIGGFYNNQIKGNYNCRRLNDHH